MIKIQYATISETGKRQKNDRIMLCSDGLYKCMSNKFFLANMMDEKSLDEILDAYRIYCEKQGNDNYTAVLMAVE